MGSRLMPTATEIAHAAAIMREALRDESYKLLPLGSEVEAYLRVKRKRLTEASFDKYERGLDKFARHFPDLDLPDFEPPVGTERVEEFLDALYGGQAPATYNLQLAIIRDFFKHAQLRGKISGDPCLAIECAKARQRHRESYTPDQRRAIIGSCESRRDRIATRLMLTYALRNGAMRSIQFKHFDANRRRLTIFTKGAKVRDVPIPDPALWDDLEKLRFEIGAEPHHYLLPSSTGNQHKRRVWRDRPLSKHGFHLWWYRRLEDAGIVPKGTQSGERPHKARHTAGQTLLDVTGGNLKAAQALLGHASIQTTGDIYTDWDVDRLAYTMQEVLDAETDPR